VLEIVYLAFSRRAAD